MTLFDVYIVNSLTDIRAIKEARYHLSQRFKLTPEKADQLLAKKRVVIKHGVDAAMAQRLSQAIRECGLEAELVERATATGELELEPKIELQSATQSIPSAAVSEAMPDNLSTHQNAYQAPNADMNQQVFCRQCGNKMSVADSRCTNCGAIALQSTGPSKVAAGFLALFLGGLGIHRFYLRQWWGVFYIPFGLVGIIAPLTIGEAIYFWCCSKDTWKRKYGHLPATSALVLVLIAVIPGIAVIGILAAVALPAYQDYTMRARVYDGLVDMRTWSTQVERVAIDSDVIPATAREANISQAIVSQHLQEISVAENGEVVGTFKPFVSGGKALTLVLAPSFATNGDDIVSVQWSCKGGTVPDKYRPHECRGGSDAVAQQSAIESTKTLRSSESGAKLEVPRGWREGVADNDEASINAGNIFAEVYTLLIEEDDPDDYFNNIDDYAETIDQIYSSSLDKFVLIDQGALTSSSGMNGKYRKFSAHAENYDIIYLVGLYEKNDRYFQVFTWSLKSRADRNEAAMWSVVKSLSVPR